MAGDSFDDFRFGPGHADVPGPYSARVSSSASQLVLQWQQQQQAAAAATAGAAADSSRRLAAPPAAPQESRFPDGRAKKVQGKNFCWGYCARRSCSDPCPDNRAHRCELCLLGHPAIACPTQPNFPHPAKGKGGGGKAKGGIAKGGKGICKGKDKGKGKGD